VMETLLTSKDDCRTPHRRHCTHMVLSGIALVTRMPPTRTKYNVQETTILMQYVRAITLARSVDRRGSTELAEPGCSTSDSAPLPFTRSRTTPLDKQLCFFCQADNGEQLFKVRSENAGKTLKNAVERSRNPALKTRLSTSISEKDAHAIDVRYHKDCWRTHVYHVLREPSAGRDTSTSQ